MVIALIEYVLCIARDLTGRFVFVKKTRPEWQAGRYNFPGGKLETEDVDIQSAAQREFLEETGVNIPAPDWQQIATLAGNDYAVYVMSTNHSAHGADTQTDEKVGWYWVSSIEYAPHLFIENCLWIAGLALDPSANRRVIVKYD
jgi:8-oxo-dGTP pyrophosphatase MutT (NUDIX family)